MALDNDAVDGALHEIQQMVEVVIRAAADLIEVGLGKPRYQTMGEDAQLLDFSTLDVAKRVKALRDAL
ncbi:MAG: hypothetical protein Q7T45_22740 [Bradyrhizobium sp.]|uniref:hypothetical protein n=1 Tax=Bradyrhizobium sp. TaxID=376 RepID=UPI002721ABA9|nr:hypothetical protein [Bradyrhizobium sp.]MDO8400636.1 hypothetical protein [Bradyrhizobium sp.]